MDYKAQKRRTKLLSTLTHFFILPNLIDKAQIPNPKSHSPLHRRRSLLSLQTTLVLLIFIICLLKPYTNEHYIFPPTLSPPPSRVQQLSGEFLDSHLSQVISRQSTSLADAKAKYIESSGLPSPPGFEKWYDYAQEHSCLMHDYNRINENFKPFIEIAKKDLSRFRGVVRNETLLIKSLEERSLASYTIHNGYLSQNDAHPTYYTRDWDATLRRIILFLPPSLTITPIFSGRDEPRILFNTNSSNFLQSTISPAFNDPHPFDNSPPPHQIAGFLEGHCDIPREYRKHPFFQAPGTTEFTTDLFPILSMATISPCFADILVPSQFYYDSSGHSPK